MSFPTKPMNSVVPSNQAVREALRNILRGWNPAAGADGFEGLVAQAMSALTGYTFRLARSGAQFGRDAATPLAPFSIAMEAKRYTNSIPLQELVGKVSLAAFELAEGIDVWALAATIEVSEPTERKLKEILDNSGISLVTLDWTEAGLPPLAVLLSAARIAILPWAERKLSLPEFNTFRDGLNNIAADPAFGQCRDALIANLSPGLVGLDAFRHRNVEWCERNFGSRKLAQRAFSQFLSPLEAPDLSIDRPTIDAAIDGAVTRALADTEGDSIVAVLGGEGSGKSWAITKWWYRANPRPILILSAGRIAEVLSNADDPLNTLAKLAAQQQGESDEANLIRWRRRLKRWSVGENSSFRFAIVIDGLNESSGKPWSAILRSLLTVTRDLGGVVIATCREAYWGREIETRLPFIAFQKVPVGDYTDAEFADLLQRHAVDPATLPSKLNRFMRNPRICSLALTMLPQLSSIDDLSVDRLLLEYWRARLLERGDLVSHDDTDFRNLLMLHAGDYRARPGTNFNRDEWRSRSGASARDDGRELANDLSDIEEGRFFDPDKSVYRFRDDALHFALGLLIADELQTAVRDLAATPDEAMAAVLDPVRSFDAVADIMGSAIAVAALDDQFPDVGIATLMAGWLSLQNVTDEAFQALVPFVAARPEPFLDAFEQRDLNTDDGRFLQLLLIASQRASVSEAIDVRLNRWFGSWSRAIDDWGAPAEQLRRRTERNARIDGDLAQLTATERAYLDRICPELSHTAALAGAAAILLHGVAQAPFAKGIVAFSFAYAIAGHHSSPLDDVAWAVRLNRIDFEELSAAVRAEIAPFIRSGASQLVRAAAARALRLLGTLHAQTEADELDPPSPQNPRVRQIDPLDPSDQAPEGVAGLAERIESIDPAAIWTQMNTTSEDYDLERALNMLVRFDPDSIIAFLDRVGGSVSERALMPLRQLGWHLPWLSPILGDGTVQAVAQRIVELSADPALATDRDENFITGMMVEGIFPHLTAAGQLDLLQSLPPKAPFYFRYSQLAKPLAADEAAQRLDDAIMSNKRILERTLLFLAANPGEVNGRLRQGLVTCLTSQDMEVRVAAADLASNCGDPELDEVVINLETPDANDISWRAAITRSAVASAIARLGRPELLDRIPVEHIDWVAARMPCALDTLADVIEAAIDRLVKPIASDEPSDAVVVLEFEEGAMDTMINLVDKGERHEDPVATFNAEMNDATGERFARRRQLLGEQLDRFLASLANENALMVARRPYRFGLEELAGGQPDRYARWLYRILDMQDRNVLRNLQNLGFALAQNYSLIDCNLAARAIAHLWKIDPHVTVRIGPAKHTIRDLALFCAAPCPEITTLREKVLETAADDSRIEELVIAAESAGQADWLNAFIARRLTSVLASDQALALTIASFRPENSQSDELFDRTWLTGFLGNAARAGGARYITAKHAAHWFDLAAEAKEAKDRWRFMQLGIATADKRHYLNTDRRLRILHREIGGDLPQRLRKSVEKATKENEKSLYGMRKPTGLLWNMISD